VNLVDGLRNEDNDTSDSEDEAMRRRKTANPAANPEESVSSVSFVSQQSNQTNQRLDSFDRALDEFGQDDEQVMGIESLKYWKKRITRCRNENNLTDMVCQFAEQMFCVVFANPRHGTKTYMNTFGQNPDHFIYFLA